MLLKGLGKELVSVSGTWMALQPWAQTVGDPLAQGIPVMQSILSGALLGKPGPLICLPI